MVSVLKKPFVSGVDGVGSIIMAKKNLFLKDLHGNIMRLKALIGYNVVINYYLDEAELMMLIGFHKIPKYKNWKPLSVQFVLEDFKEDSSVINLKVADLVKQYMEERVSIEKQNYEMVEITKNIDFEIKTYKKKNKKEPNFIMVGMGLIKYFAIGKEDSGDFWYKEYHVIGDVNALPKSIVVGYDKKLVIDNKVIYEKRITDSIKKFEKEHKLIPNEIILGADVFSSLDPKDNYKKMKVISGEKVPPDYIKIKYVKRPEKK